MAGRLSLLVTLHNGSARATASRFNGRAWPDVAGRRPSTKTLARGGPGHSDRKRDPCVGFSSWRSLAAYAARRLVNLVRSKLYLLAG